MLKSAVAGAAGSVVGDLATTFVPGAVDVGGMPVRQYGGACLGAYAGLKAMKGHASVMNVLLLGVLGTMGANLGSRFLPSFSLGPVNVTRAAASAATGVVVGFASKKLLHKKAE